MSLSMSVVRWYLGTRPRRLRTAESARAVADSRPESAPVPARLRRHCSVTVDSIGGCQVTTLTPLRAGTRVELLYLHGGAFINSLQAPHWSIISALIARTGATVTVPHYGLAPEHTAAEALALTTDVYSTLVKRGSRSAVYLAGDSAGGTLALTLTIACRDNGSAAPAGLFLFAPWLDLTMSNPAARALVPSDVMLDVDGLVWCAEQWARSSSLADPAVNPMADHLRDLPAIHLYQGERDIFLADALKFTEKAGAAGSPVDLQVFPAGFHVFVGATFTPEARQVFAHVAEVIRGRRSA